MLLFLLNLFPTAAFAADSPLVAKYSNIPTQTLDVNGAQMTVTFPEGWDVLTRNTPADFPALSKYGIVYEEFISNMESQSIYIDAINPDTQNQIYVSLVADEASIQYPNLSALSDEEISGLIEESRTYMTGYDLSAFSWKNVGDYKYLYYEFGNPAYVMQYTTTVNGQYVSIILQNFNYGPFSAEEKDAMSNVLNSVSFSNTAPSGSLNNYPAESAAPLIVAVIIGAAVIALLLLLLSRYNKKTLYVSQSEYASLYGIRGFLAFMAFRIILGIILGLGSLYNLDTGTIFYALYILLILMVFADLIMLFAKVRAFIMFYVMTNIYSAILNIAMFNYAGAGVVIAIESLFILYLFRSKRVAVTFKTHTISITHPSWPDEPENQTAAAPPRSNPSVSNLEELKRVNPVAYKRNIVATAAGYRDFAGMISANPDLENSLAFAVSPEDLNNVAAAYGFQSFEEMYDFSLKAQKAEEDHPA